MPLIAATRASTIQTYSWGLDDRLLKAVDALEHQVHYQHDVLGNLTAAHYSDQADDVRLPDAVVQFI